MNRPIEDSGYSDLKQEVEALRKKIEEMESTQARSTVAGRATGGRRLFRNPALAVSLVAVGALLTLGVLSAQSGRDALFINQSGNVGINQPKPDKTLDVNGNAIIRGPIQVGGDQKVNGGVGVNTAPIANQNLVIIPTQGNMPFNVTNPAAKINWLSVMADGNVVMNGGKIGIGTTTPGARLTIRNNLTDLGKVADGKVLFVSGTFGTGRDRDGGIEFRHDNLTQGIGFGYETIYATGKVDDQPLNLIAKGSGNITLNAYGGATGNVGIGANNPQAKLYVKGEIRGKPWRSTEIYEWKQGQGAKQMTKVDHTVCFLTLVAGKFQGWAEYVQITESNGYWMLGGNSQQQDVRAKAMCIGAPDNSW